MILSRAASMNSWTAPFQIHFGNVTMVLAGGFVAMHQRLARWIVGRLRFAGSPEASGGGNLPALPDLADERAGHTSCRVQIRGRAFTHGGVWTLAWDVRCQHRHELQK